MTKTKLTSDYQLFSDGIKPAYYRSYAEVKEEIENLKDEHPHYAYHARVGSESRGIIFFQTESALNDFKEKHHSILEHTLQTGEHPRKEYARLLGHALGFPPNCVEYFATLDKQNIQKHMGIYYYGMSFRANPDTIEEDLQWLKDNIPVPEGYPGKVHLIDRTDQLVNANSDESEKGEE